MRICVIFNPAAKGNKARHFRRHLNEIAADCALKPTQQAGEAAHLAREAVEEGFDTIVAAGGDGTVNEVLNGIADAKDGFHRARLAVLPLGTVNVFAREHGIPLRLRRAWETVRHGSERTIDLPWIKLESNGRTRRACFAQMAGAGLDARAVELVSWALKKRTGQLAYLVAGFRAFYEHRPVIECSAGGQRVAGQLILLGNGRLYGGPLPVFGRAALGDGLIDVCVFPRVTWFTLWRYTIGYVTGRVFPPADMKYFQCDRVELRGVERAPVEIDGELAGVLPATVTVESRRLRVIAV